MRRPVSLFLAGLLTLAGCQTTGVTFQSTPLSRLNPQAETVAASLAKPEGPGPFPAVVLLHSCGGLMRHLPDWSAFLKSRGYAVLTVDSFGSRGQPRCPNKIGTHTWAGLEIPRDAYGALDYLATQPGIAADRIFVMGFSLGGWAIRNMAKQDSFSRERRDFRAAVSVYDGCEGYAGRLTFPTMVVIGTLDGRDFPSCKLAAETKPSPDLELHILDGVYHGFDEPSFSAIRYDVGGRPMLYDGRAVARSKQLVEAFLAKHLK